MNHKLYDALEVCLQAMENGASPEAVLARYPELAHELRPLVEAARQARELTIPAPSAEAMRRGRQRLLQRAGQMRPRRVSVIPLVQRLAFAVALASIFLLSGTGLVNASSTTLPGDQLYPVKRTWEDVRLLFVFQPTHRYAMESEYERERLDEAAEVLRKGRQVDVVFSGLITLQQNGSLLVSGVPVLISDQTQFSGDPASVGSSVLVSGKTDINGHVVASSVHVLPPGSLVPLGEPEDEHDTQSSPVVGSTPGSGPQNQSGEGESSGSGRQFHLEGTIQSIQGNLWVVDGQTIYIEQTQVPGAVAVGMRVEVKGYFTSDGRFVVTEVEPKSSDGEEENQQGEQQGGSEGQPEGEQEEQQEHEEEQEQEQEQGHEQDQEHEQEQGQGSEGVGH